ncbi:MAG TPA: transcription-repair coupling factor [Candidatus Limnocylindrales bacterium]|nr:transcription-repair coupling factor [Candidatus Limnocylindrales bacterium]
MILPLVGELLARVGRQPAVEECLDRLRRGVREVVLTGLTDPAKALLTAIAARSLAKQTILLVDSNQRADDFAGLALYFLRALGKANAQVTVLPAHEVFPYDHQSPHPEISEARAAALWRLTSGEADLVIAPIAAAVLRLREPQYYRSLALALARGEEVPREELLAHLASVGYEAVETVEMPGQFAVRGGILDVFPPEAERPVRLELLGDTLETLREFDTDTQRSTSPVERVVLLPLTDCPRTAEQLARLGTLVLAGHEDAERRAPESPAGFFPGWEFRAFLADRREANLLGLRDNALVIEDEPAALDAALEKYRARFAEAAAKEPEAAPPESYILSDEEWQRAKQATARFGIERLAIEKSGGSQFTLPTRPTTRYHGNVAAFMAELKGRLNSGEQIFLSAASTGELERLADLCHEFELPFRLGELGQGATASRLADESSAGSVPAAVLVKAPLEEGVEFVSAALSLFGNSDLFETVATPSPPRSRAKTGSFFSDFSELKAGDFVVHVDHGIGRFQGLRQVSVDSVNGEFLLLEYAEDAKVYVPLTRLDLVQKYQSLGGAEPRLDKLGSQAWEARKSRVRKSVGDMAQQLLRLYAERKSVEGHAFPADTPWQKEFEDAFEFQETADQDRAIEDVKRDLERAQPMDRLLCGDVGYGKTEVAMRAAFKAVSDSKQVAVLAPTTVLAFQHHDTFRRRFAAFPVRIAMLSRFQNPREQKQILADLEAGKIDIVIGTHRLLSKDVKFQDLGLLVVDEEQRFGVGHKERIKEMRKNVDVLTMSATPIPRTLHMSLVGLRDMSVIETPPKDRLAIQTVVAPFDRELIRRAISEEMERDGQVFFVHNRVESIASLAMMVQELVPKARIVVGHGQMSEGELSKVMMKFIRHEADVLMATTIIENGLDIPRANTILINRADRFGLAELYQLRGRVGRSNQRAYAYLLVPPEVSLSGLARQRLAALKEFSDLGAGFRIAALDLELRGAGNILGSEQHGHIESVGFDLYCQMLERAVAERKGEVVQSERRATLNLGLDIRIPEDYIENESSRLRIYKRIAGVSSEEARQEVLAELRDRFGQPPKAVENLLEYALLKALAEKLLVASIDRRGERAAIRWHEDTPVRPEKLVKMIRSRKDMRLDPSGTLWMEWKRPAEGIAEAMRKVLLQLQA